MKSQPDLEERFRAAADRLEVGPPPLERIVRRGRRRSVVRATTAAVLVVVVGAVLVRTGLSLSGFREELRLGDGTTIPKPRIVATIRLSGFPWGVTFDRQKVWVASYFDDLILEVEPATNTEIRRISVPGKVPYELVAGEGTVWAGAYSSILRIDAATGRVNNFDAHLGFTGHGYPSGMAFADGALWIGDSQRNRVLRVDPRSLRVAAEITMPGATTEMAAVHVQSARLPSGDGSLWVGGCHGEGPGAPLDEIDTRTNQVVSTIRLPAPGCVTLPAVGPEALYGMSATNEKDPHTKLWKVDPRTRQVIGGPVSLSAPGNLIEYRGALWVLTRDPNVGAGSFLTVIDPTTMKVLARMSVGQNAWRIAVGDGSLWVPAVKDGSPVLFRINP